MSEKPIAYLDVDDTLLMWTNEHPNGDAHPNAGEFVKWLNKHFEVRWLTAWCPCGTMEVASRLDLAHRLGIDDDELTGIVNPLGWHQYKTDGIEWPLHRAGREWVWIEDEILPNEKYILQADVKNWYPCDVSKDPDALIQVWNALRERFNISE